MSKCFKISMLSLLIPVLTSLFGFLIVPHQIIVQFNQPTYDNKIWIFFIPTILIFLNCIFAFLVIKDRKKRGFISPVIATSLENRLIISNFLLVLVVTIILVYQILNAR